MARPAKTSRLTTQEYLDDLTTVFSFTENVFKELKDSELEQFDDSLKIKSGWGQVYDIEQMTEHAIVHILRHRRQIERFKILIDNGGNV
ncbi:MAG: DinB family protein [Mucilaginibacter sp.]|nr:DinB family protein [Mucilaginibacter sp.]